MSYTRRGNPTELIFGSPCEQPFTVSSVAADHTFTDATITIPSWLKINTIAHAFLDMYVPYIQNTNAGSNWISASQYIYASIDGGAYHQANKIFNSAFYLAPSMWFTGQYINLGMYDLISYLANDCTITLLWDNAQSHVDSLNFGNIWFVLRVITK